MLKTILTEDLCPALLSQADLDVILPEFRKSKFGTIGEFVADLIRRNKVHEEKEEMYERHIKEWFEKWREEFLGSIRKQTKIEELIEQRRGLIAACRRLREENKALKEELRKFQ